MIAHTASADKRQKFRLRHQALHAWARRARATRQQLDAVRSLCARRLLLSIRSAFCAWRRATARQWAVRRPFHARLAWVLRRPPEARTDVRAVVLAEWQKLSPSRSTDAVATWAAAGAARRRKAVLFCRWARRAGELQQQRHLLHSSRTVMAEGTLRRALEAWRAAASASRVAHVLEYQATCFWIKRALTNAWIEWRQCVCAHVAQRRELTRAGRIHSGRVLGRAWGAWRTVVAVRGSAEMQLLLAQQRRLRELLLDLSRGGAPVATCGRGGSQAAEAWAYRHAWRAWRAAIGQRNSALLQAERLQCRLRRRMLVLCMQEWCSVAERQRHATAVVTGRMALVLDRGSVSAQATAWTMCCGHTAGWSSVGCMRRGGDLCRDAGLGRAGVAYGCRVAAKRAQDGGACASACTSSPAAACG